MKNQILKNRITFFSKTNTHSREKVGNLLILEFKKSEIHFSHRGYEEEKKMQMRLATDEHGLSLMKAGRSAEAKTALSRYLTMQPNAADAPFIRQMIG